MTQNLNNSKIWAENLGLIHSDLIAANNLIYNPCGLKVSAPIPDKESSKYGGYWFALNDAPIMFRVAKITPTKIGQFVTLYRRIGGKGPTKPYTLEDAANFFIVSTRQGDNFGQFIFPKIVLHEHGIISNNDGTGGKWAIRVYPPWDIAINKQAKNTQAWQLEYFVDASSNTIDHKRIHTLLDKHTL